MYTFIVYLVNMNTGERDAVYIFDDVDRPTALRIARQCFVNSLQWKIVQVTESKGVNNVQEARRSAAA